MVYDNDDDIIIVNPETIEKDYLKKEHLKVR